MIYWFPLIREDEGSNFKSTNLLRKNTSTTWEVRLLLFASFLEWNLQKYYNLFSFILALRELSYFYGSARRPWPQESGSRLLWRYRFERACRVLKLDLIAIKIGAHRCTHLEGKIKPKRMNTTYNLRLMEWPLDRTQTCLICIIKMLRHISTQEPAWEHTHRDVWLHTIRAEIFKVFYI